MKSLTLLVSCAALSAQTPTFPYLVLTAIPGGNPAVRIVEVDPATGATTLAPRFPSDTLRPSAIAIDGIDGAVLVALDQGGGQSRIVRLDRRGASYVENLVATLPGRVAELAIAAGDLLAAVDDPNGGLYRMPRRGGSATLVLSQINLTAMHVYAPSSSHVYLAFTGRAGTPVPLSGTGLFDLASGQFVIGPDSFPNQNAVEVTGVIDLPTALIRQFVSFSNGTFARFTAMPIPTLTPVPTTPAVPPGGAWAMHPSGPYSTTALALGGAAYPFLYSVDAFTGQVIVNSTPLPGDPVDFAPGISPVAHSEYFGGDCGAITLSPSHSGAPRLGTTFSVAVSGPPLAPVFLVGGLEDFVPGVVPAPLPGGCRLDVSPLSVAFAQLMPNGTASYAINVPGATAFAGTALFFQWVHFDPAGLSTSSAVAHWIGY
ncbi:MAG: hypothetical protein KDC98_17555 [Planctomycetes bacterium]|nr:hypothetical protein [Planctomycetota bacterium]